MIDRHSIVSSPVLAGCVVAVAGTLSVAQDVDQTPAPPAMQVEVSVTGARLAAAGAITDSLEEGVKRVLVRVVDEIDLELRFVPSRTLMLTQPLYLCLVGPYWAPDDAGLSDRCWGEPDLGAEVAAAMRGEDGVIRFEAGVPIVISTCAATIHLATGSWRSLSMIR